jgi:Domain of unknown function (DUF397)
VEESIELCWRKSSYSGNGGASCVEVASDHWRKSSYSGNGGGDCVEVATLPSIVLVRDSKDREGPELTVSDQAWSAFVQGIKHREFDR